MFKHIRSLAILSGLLLWAAGVAQADTGYSPVTTRSSISPAEASATYFKVSSGSWTTSGNWSNGIPTSSLNAYISGGGSSGYTAGLSATGSANSLYIGTNTSGYVGAGTLNLTGGASLNVAHAYIGYQSNGALSVSSVGSPGASFSGGPSYIGGYTGYTGTTATVSVSGNTAMWTVNISPGNIYTGYYGPGSLSITSGGRVSDTTGDIGGSTTFSGGGTVTVDGSGSQYTNSGALYVGIGGAGTLNVSNGGTASNSYTSTVYVGYQNAGGTLNVTNGGTFNTSAAYLGGSSSYAAPGTATVDGSGSAWTLPGGTTSPTATYLYIGQGSYSATLHITNGGAVNNTFTDSSGSLGFPYLSGSTDVGNTTTSAGVGTTGTLDFGSSSSGPGVLNTRSLFAVPSQMTGTGTINAHGWIADQAIGFNASTGLAPSYSLSDANGGTVTLNLNMATAANNGVLGAGYAGTGSLTISGGQQVTSSAGYLGYKTGSVGSGAVNGSGSSWTIGSGGLYVGNSGTGSLFIANGGAVIAKALSVGSGSVLSIDVGSSLTVGTGTSTLTNSGTVRVVAGADPGAASTYTPIAAASVGGTVQAVGGTWTSATNLFTVSAALSGTSGAPLSMDTSVNQRAAWTDANGNTLGASFLAAASSNPISPIVTALGGSAVPSGLAYNQFAVADWGVSGVTASSSNPIYLSLSANNPIFNNYTLWCYNGASWSPITAPGSATGTVANDLAFDGTSYGFSLLGSGGNGLDFNNYDYAVVGTPALAGDVNLDGRVDINDLTSVLGNYGNVGMTWTQGSLDGDPTGTVDINDLTIVLNAYGSTVAASGGIGVSAVPEPSTIALLLAATACLFAWARRRRSA